MPDEKLKDTPHIPISELKPEDILPNAEHFKELKRRFVLHCIRILLRRVECLKKYGKTVSKHIPHKYTDEMKHASVIVSVKGKNQLAKSAHQLYSVPTSVT